MCLSPITIDNPNFGLSSVGNNFLKDCDSKRIAIPCHHCAECIAVDSMYKVQTIIMESLYNHIFFCTLTYSNEFLPEIVTSAGYPIHFADIHDLQLMFKRMRQDPSFPLSFRYFAVTEFGSLRGRPHFHILFLVPKKSSDNFGTCLTYEHILQDYVLKYYSRNIGSDRCPKYVPLFEYHEKYRSGKLYKNFDLHYVVPSLTASGVSDVAFYVLKYMLKPNSFAEKLQRKLKLTYSYDEYSDVWSIVRPRSIHSPFFGFDGYYVNGRTPYYNSDIISYLRDGVKRSDVSRGYPCFFHPENGMTFPLAPVYKKKGSIYSFDDACRFYFGRDDSLLELREGRSIVNQMDKFEKTCRISDSHCFDDIFTNI